MPDFKVSWDCILYLPAGKKITAGFGALLIAA
jgi:hypothetical protein